MLRSSAVSPTLYVYTGTRTPSAMTTDSGFTGYAKRFDPYGTPTLTAADTDVSLPTGPLTREQPFTVMHIKWSGVLSDIDLGPRRS
ncbi:MAG: hypothetical protein INR66_25920 [Gordonia polyisoprenivorans]|nr:hypothetical protein [Gordonia polyisoprenivorans]